MTEKIDFSKLTEKQRYVLGMIAMNEDGGYHPKTLEALLAKGLICRHEEMLPGVIPVRFNRYTVPTHVHIRWCEWCSKNVTDEGNI